MENISDKFFPVYFFKCKNETRFIQNSNICDGEIHCKHGSDEIFCEKFGVFANKLQFNGCSFPILYFAKCDTNTNSTIYFLMYMKRISVNGNYTLEKDLNSYNLKIINITRNFKLSTWNLKNIQNVFKLILNENNLKNLNFINNQSLSLLQSFSLSKNHLTSVSFFKRITCVNLKNLDISYSKIQSICKDDFSKLKNLQILKIENSFIKKIEKKIFKNFLYMEKIYLNNTNFPIKNSIENFKYLIRLKVFMSENYYFCCIVLSYLNEDIQCSPKNDNLKNCHKILPTIYLRIFSWSFGSFCLLGNVLLILRIILSEKSFISQLYHLNLNLSDSLSSLYVLLVSIANKMEDDYKFLEIRQIWKTSIFCTFLGCLMTFSLISGILSVLFITLERYEITMNPLKDSKIKKYNKYFLCFIIFFSLFFSYFPLLIHKVI